MSKPLVQRVFPLERAAASALMERGANFGKTGVAL
jgi:hypothetical protein